MRNVDLDIVLDVPSEASKEAKKNTAMERAMSKRDQLRLLRAILTVKDDATRKQLFATLAKDGHSYDWHTRVLFTLYLAEALNKKLDRDGVDVLCSSASQQQNLERDFGGTVYFFLFELIEYNNDNK